MAKQNKKLKKQIRKAGSEISGKELQKIGEKTGASALKIAQQAAKIYADQSKTTPTFTKGAAKQLTKQARQVLGPDEGYQAGTLEPFNRLMGNLSRIQTQDRLKQLGISPQFAANVADFGKFGKGQVLSIGQRGTGAIIPRRGEFKLPKGKKGEKGTQGEMAGMDMYGEYDPMAGMADLFASTRESDQAYMGMLANQQQSMQDAMTQAIAALSQPQQMPTINIPEPIMMTSPGANYNVAGVRATNRSPMRRTDYLRDMMVNQPIAQSLTTSPIGGINI